MLTHAPSTATCAGSGVYVETRAMVSDPTRDTPRNLKFSRTERRGAVSFCVGMPATVPRRPVPWQGRSLHGGSLHAAGGPPARPFATTTIVGTHRLRYG